MHENKFLEIKHLKKYFSTPKGTLHAVDDINFEINQGETLGLVGESGCGKSTTGRLLLRLLNATSGEVLFKGHDIMKFNHRQMKDLRKKAQIVFQDPYASLNPRYTISESIMEPLIVNKAYKRIGDVNKRVVQLMDTVGLARRLINAYPHELDGGRRQRVGVARALALQPEFIVLDEPVSALDVSIQAQILNLLDELQTELNLTYLFISHNLSVVKHVSKRIAVMYLGQIVEMADCKTLFNEPLHPYTKALISAIPIAKVDVKNKRIILKGDVPNPIEPPEGCRFFDRCMYGKDICSKKTPELKKVGPGRQVACYLYEDMRGIEE